MPIQNQYLAILYRFATFAVPALIILVVFSGTLSNGLVWDDIQSFHNSARYQDKALIWRVFTEPLIFSGNYYRPLVSSSFVLQNSLFGIDDRGLHLVSLLLHVGNSLLLVLLSQQLLKRWGSDQQFFAYAPPVVGLFYGVHPTLIEPVVFASSRFDLMVTLFVLLSMLSLVCIKNNLIRALVAGFCFFLAALSKEMAVGYALALPLWLLAIEPHTPKNIGSAIQILLSRRNLNIFASILVAGLLYIVLRQVALGGLLPVSAENLWTPTQRLLLVLRSIFEYLQLALMPFGQINPAHPLAIPITLGDPRTLLALAISPIYILTTGILFRKHSRIALFLAMGLLSLAPVLGFFPLPRPADLYFGESYLALPMIFFSLLLLVLWHRFRHSSHNGQNYRIAVFFLGCIWLLSSMATVATTVPLWKNRLTFWGWIYAKQPELSASKIGLAAAWFSAGDKNKALELIDQTLVSDYNNPFAWNLRGLILDAAGNKTEALDSHYRAVTLAPKRVPLWIDLSISLSKAGQLEASRNVLLHEVIPRDPDNWVAHAHLGFVSRDLGDKKLALGYFRKALPLAPIGTQRQRIEQAVREIESQPANSQRRTNGR